ncbi:MAG TPA: helix-turn-helix transcriptional regulator [Fimbriimonadaceae bacterium]|nr:helix-turn-helix transcriptional regulator [Fimbriimonadaceae bacterium]
MGSENAIGRLEHDALRHLIARWRTESGLTQRELSARLHRSHNYIVKIETGVRGLEVVDLVDILRALGKPLLPAFEEYCRAISSP